MILLFISDLFSLSQGMRHANIRHILGFAKLSKILRTNVMFPQKMLPFGGQGEPITSDFSDHEYQDLIFTEILTELL